MSNRTAIKYLTDGIIHLYDGVPHRVGGPATMYDSGHLGWWYHGQRHRLDGPAIERNWEGGVGGVHEYWVHGIQYSYEDFLDKAWLPAQEMTMQQICNAFGYNIKIVG